MIKYWNIPKLWKKAAVFIFGGGPSFLDLIDQAGGFSAFESKRVIGCNDNYLLGSPPVDICYFGDETWFKAHYRRSDTVNSENNPCRAQSLQRCSDLRSFTGLKVTSCPFVTSETDGDILRLRRVSHDLALKDSSTIGWYRNTGTSAINLAIKLGATTIILIGFDMKIVGGKQNWYPSRNRGDKTNPKMFPTHLSLMETLSHQIQKECPQVKIWNTTPNTAIPYFEHLDIQEAIQC